MAINILVIIHITTTVMVFAIRSHHGMERILLLVLQMAAQATSICAPSQWVSRLDPATPSGHSLRTYNTQQAGFWLI